MIIIRWVLDDQLGGGGKKVATFRWCISGNDVRRRLEVPDSLGLCKLCGWHWWWCPDICDFYIDPAWRVQCGPGWPRGKEGSFWTTDFRNFWTVNLWMTSLWRALNSLRSRFFCCCEITALRCGKHDQSMKSDAVVCGEWPHFIQIKNNPTN